MGGEPRDDGFEAREMHDGAPVVHRDKKVSRAMAALLAVPGLLAMLVAAFVGIANATSHEPLPAEALPVVALMLAALGVLFVGMGVVFGVLRTIVTERAVHVRYGLWGPTIPLEAIRSCDAVDYDWTEFGGWGLRRGRGGAWAYMPVGKRAVEIRYREGDEEKRVLVGAGDPEATARAIRAALERRDAGEHVRVGTVGTEVEEVAEQADDDEASDRRKMSG
jgi:hypothetical protein